jgi:hypothetical protein
VTRRRLAAAATALLVACGGTASVAAGEGANKSTVASLKKKRVGFYTGTTEEGGTVSFRITNKLKVIGFTMPDVPVTCTLFQPDENVSSAGKPFTIRPPAMKLRKGPKFLYEDPPVDGPFQGIHVDGKGASDGGMKGNAAMISQDGVPFQDGTTHCDTEYVDWEANRVGKKK